VRRIALAVMSTVVVLVLLFSYRTSRGPVERSTAAPPGVRSPQGTTPSPTGWPAASPAEPPATAGPDRSPTDAGGGTVVADGQLVQTVQGPVQVRVTVTGRRIVDVAVLVRPSGAPHHDEVNGYALPLLREQALRAQSAEIDGVSGATATSGGYRASLQSALDAANGR
jgi:uncharacterized protein with FMN-binding domain